MLRPNAPAESSSAAATQGGAEGEMKRALGERAARIRASMGGDGVSDEPSSKERMALTVAEVAEKLGLHENTVYRLLRSGELPGRRLGRRVWRVSAAGLGEWLRGRNGQTQVAGRGVDLPENHETARRADSRPLAGAVESRRSDPTPFCDADLSDKQGSGHRSRRASSRPRGEAQPVAADPWRLPPLVAR